MISAVLIIFNSVRTCIMQQYVNLTIMIGITRIRVVWVPSFQKSLRISMLRRDPASEKKKKKKGKKLGTGMGGGDESHVE